MWYEIKKIVIYVDAVTLVDITKVNDSFYFVWINSSIIFLSFSRWYVKYRELGTVILMWYFWQNFTRSRNHVLFTHLNGWLMVESIDIEIPTDNWKWWRMLIIRFFWTGWRKSLCYIWIFLILCAGRNLINSTLEYLFFCFLVLLESYSCILYLLRPLNELDLV